MPANYAHQSLYFSLSPGVAQWRQLSLYPRSGVRLSRSRMRVLQRRCNKAVIICTALVATGQSAPQSEKASLAETHPELAHEWHPTKNGDRKTAHFTYGSNVKVWWLCPKACSGCGAAHEWEAQIDQRTRRNPTGCPSCCGQKVCKCSSLAALRPDLLAQWDFARNVHLDPEQIGMHSMKMVSWVCPKHGPWSAAVNMRVAGRGCAMCAAERRRQKQVRRGRLSDEHPELVAQLHPTENAHIDLDKVTSGSGIKVVWVCDNHDHAPPGCTHPHIWTAAIHSRVYHGTGCPFCAGRVVCPCNSLAVKVPEVAAEWHPCRNGNKQPDQFAACSNSKMWWQHVGELTGNTHEWQAQVKSRVRTWKKEGRLSCPLCHEDRQQRPIRRAIE